MCPFGIFALRDAFTSYHNETKLHPSTNKLALIGIWTAHWKKERRALIRMTYLRHRPFNMDYYFFVCSSMTAVDHLWITFENKMYQDMVIMNCIDNSHHGKIWNFIQSVRAISNRGGNLTDSNGSIASHLNISLLIEDYPHFSDVTSSYDFIVKVDDDSYIHLINLESSLLSLDKTSLIMDVFGIVIPMCPLLVVCYGPYLMIWSSI